MLKQELKLTTRLDMPFLGVAGKELEGCLQLDDCDTPSELRIFLRNLPADKLAVLYKFDEFRDLNGRTIDGVLNDGRHFTTRIDFVTSVQPAFDPAMGLSAVITFLIQGTRYRTAHALNPTAKWLFRLVNVKVFVCDEATEVASGSWSVDKIPFLLDNRRWVLRNINVGSIDNQSNKDEHLPLITASLETDALAPDSFDSIAEISSDICRLLSIALSRHITWISITAMDDANNPVEELAPNIKRFPFSQSSFPAVDNWERGCLRAFIEKAWLGLRDDPDWFRPTLDNFVQARISASVESRSVFLNILADRIANRVRDKQAKHEIDANLKGKMDSQVFKEQLTALFSSITANWTPSRTDALINTVNSWNTTPSFPEGIRRACRILRLPEPSSSFLATRHKLLHEGELTPYKGDGINYCI